MKGVCWGVGGECTHRTQDNEREGAECTTKAPVAPRRRLLAWNHSLAGFYPWTTGMVNRECIRVHRLMGLLGGKGTSVSGNQASLHRHWRNHLFFLVFKFLAWKVWIETFIPWLQVLIFCVFHSQWKKLTSDTRHVIQIWVERQASWRQGYGLYSPPLRSSATGRAEEITNN